jgi:hypothetical protein
MSIAETPRLPAAARIAAVASATMIAQQVAGKAGIHRVLGIFFIPALFRHRLAQGEAGGRCDRRNPPKKPPTSAPVA